MKTIYSLIILISVLCLTTAAQKITFNEQKTIKSLQHFYSVRDYDSGYELGKKVSPLFPKNTELQCWYVLNAVNADHMRDVSELADKINKDDKDNIWALLALGSIYVQRNQFDKARPISENLIALSPQNEEGIFLYISVLSGQKEYSKALEFLNRNAGSIKNKARILDEQARIYYLQNEKDKSFAAFNNVIKANPDDINSNYLLGVYLNKNERFDEAVKYLQHAVQLSPGAFSIREEFWNAIWKSKSEKTSEQRKIEISANIDSYNKAQKLSSVVLLRIVNKSREFQLPDKEKEFSDLILSGFPNTRESERILVNKYRAIDYHDKDWKFIEPKRLEYVQALRRFIALPQHFDLFFLGDAYGNLIYALEKDDTFSNSDFLALSRQAVQYRGVNNSMPYTMIVEGLLYRKMLPESESFALMGLTKFDAEMEKIRKSGSNEDFIKISEKFDKTKLLNSLGEALMAEKKYDKAETAFSDSAKIETEPTVLNLLGKLYEAQNKSERAESAYIDALSAADHPNYADIKNFYLNRNGSLSGYEPYLKKIKQSVGEKRKSLIVAQRETNPQDLMPFNLKTFKLNPISSNELRGKVVIINMWATWCGPCVAELPELQKLYEKYKDNPDVSILSMDVDEDADTIRNFMDEKKYSFPVLISEKYLSENGVAIFPTTWFVNKEGKKAFIKFGTSPSLFEEFDWRIESLLK